MLRALSVIRNSPVVGRLKEQPLSVKVVLLTLCSGTLLPFGEGCASHSQATKSHSVRGCYPDGGMGGAKVPKWILRKGPIVAGP